MITRTLVFLAVMAAACPAAWRDLRVSEPEPLYSICAHGDTVWAGVDGGTRRSLDGGETWPESGSGTGPKTTLGLARAQNGLAAYYWRYLYGSEDGGFTWSLRDSLDLGGYYSLDERNDTLFAPHSLFPQPPPDGVRYSADGGRTWKDLPAERSTPWQPIPPAPVAFRGDTFTWAGDSLYRRAGTESQGVLGVHHGIRAVAASSRRLMVITGDEVGLYSLDGRSGWTQIATRASTPDIRSFAADSASLAFSTPRGVYLSKDFGRAWQIQAQARLRYAYDQIQLHLTRDYLIAGTDWGWFKFVSLDGPTPLASEAAGGSFLPFLGAAGTWIAYIQNRSSTVVVSTDQGTRFNSCGALPVPLSKGDLAVGRRALAATDGTGAWVSRDTALTWTRADFCEEPIRPSRLALTDSALFILGADGHVWRSRSLGARCDWDTLPLPDGVTPMVPGAFLAGTRSLLYLGTPHNGVWSWDEGGSPASAKGGKSGTGRAARTGTARPSPDDPTPVWSLPGADRASGLRVDAKGVVQPLPSAPTR
jgi:hypothetical protein